MCRFCMRNRMFTNTVCKHGLNFASLRSCRLNKRLLEKAHACGSGRRHTDLTSCRAATLGLTQLSEIP